jgi:hypothetical protein
MIEEELRGQLIQVLSAYSQGGMSLGSIYYILKDVFKDLEQSYFSYVQQQQQQQQEQKATEENEEEEDLSEEIEEEVAQVLTNLEEGETLEYE